MLTGLALRNFKAWKDSGVIELGPITAFFGSNSSGKTSFLQSLLLLKQTTDSADRGRVFDLGGPGSLVNLGTFRDIVFGHDTARPVGVSVSWQEERPFEIRDPEEKKQPVITSAKALSLSVDVTEIGSFPAVERVVYGLGNWRFSLTRRGHKNEYDLESGEYRFKSVPGRTWPLPAPGKFYSFPDQVRAYFQNAAFLSDLELKFENCFGRIFYLGPLRQDPERQYIRSGGRPIDVGRRGELAIDALIASKSDGKVNSRGFVTGKGGAHRRTPRITVEEHVASWLKELNLISSFMVEAVDDRETLYRVSVRRTPTSPPVLLPDVGFGVSQVLPVLVLLAYVPAGSTVLLEQPEIHLHPAVQSGLADIVVEAAQVRNIQVLIESHSEHLLLRLQRRIAEGGIGKGITLDADDCRFYFCKTANGASALDRLHMDPFGNITNWPEDFFGDSFGETAAMTRAVRRRLAEGAPA